MRVGAYAGWGLGAAGMAVFTIYGIKGNQMSDDASDKCGSDENGQSRCTQAERDRLIADVDDTFLIANIGLGVGVAGLAAGTVLFFLSQEDGEAGETGAEETVRVDVAPTPGGGFFSVSGTF